MYMCMYITERRIQVTGVHVVTVTSMCIHNYKHLHKQHAHVHIVVT